MLLPSTFEVVAVMIKNSTYMSFHPILVAWFLVVFGDEVTKVLPNSLFTFFTEQGKTGKTEI